MLPEFADPRAARRRPRAADAGVLLRHARGEEIAVEIEPGKTLIVKFLTIGDRTRRRRVLIFELNGQPRTIADESARVSGPKRRKVTPGRPGEVGAPMPGGLSIW